jgi:hypothetical protein
MVKHTCILNTLWGLSQVDLEFKVSLAGRVVQLVDYLLSKHTFSTSKNERVSLVNFIMTLYQKN